MALFDKSDIDNKIVASSILSYVQFGALLLLLWWCLTIIAPFLNLIVWGIVISVAAFPQHRALTAKLGGRARLSSVILTLVGIAIIVLPAWILAESTIDGMQQVAAEFEDGTIDVPPPNPAVAEWPLVGEKLYALWTQAETNLEGVVNKFEPQIKALGEKLLGAAAAGVGGVLQMVLSMIIAGALLSQAAPGYNLTRMFFSRLMGEQRGPGMADLSISIIRSVVKGVLGIALIQTVLAVIGLLVMGVPGAGLIGFFVLVLAIVQLPPILILGPVAAWVYSFADPVPATIFLVYSLVVSGSDAFLKPLLLGRGVQVPMLVILLGAIGGAISMGILGLFLGAVILALGYELLRAWLNPEGTEEEASASSESQ
ncbi:MAG: AI-2E family transporter [Gammaproteobacteria bacterium]|nr:AI-2E family transporter [Gammaproteobacteria bacterium]